MTGARTWDLLTTWDVEPAFAMGLDEALLASAGSPPTLRLYTWKPDALSLGYFQAFEDVPAAANHPRVVRRLTGGGAIHHHPRELTFSVAIDADDPAYQGPVPRSYERMHGAIRTALEALGARGVQLRGSEPVDSDRADTGMCFHASTALDLCWPVRGTTLAKGVGTAQRRTRGRVLHHGSIKLGPADLEEGIGTLADVGLDVDLWRAGAALAEAVAGVFDVEMRPVPLSADLAAKAEQLGLRYVDPAFVNRRRRGRSVQERD